LKKAMVFLLHSWKWSLRWLLIKRFFKQNIENPEMKNLLFVSFIFCSQIPLSGAIST